MARQLVFLATAVVATLGQTDVSTCVALFSTDGDCKCQNDSAALFQVASPKYQKHEVMTSMNDWNSSRDLARVWGVQPVTISPNWTLQIFSAVPVFGKDESYIALLVEHNGDAVTQGREGWAHEFDTFVMFCAGPDGSHKTQVISRGQTWVCPWPREERESKQFKEATLEQEVEQLMDSEYGDLQEPPRKKLRGRNLFNAFSDVQQEIHAEPAPPRPIDPPVDESFNLIKQWKTYKAWSSMSFPHAEPPARTLLEVTMFLSSMNAANYMMSSKQKLLLIMLIDGEHWRAHNKQIFKYHAGAWEMVSSLQIEVWDIFLAVEGLFLTSAKHFEDQGGDQPKWKWENIKDKAIASLFEHVHDALQFFGDHAKESSDHLRQVTGNKSWKAGWMRRVADMLANFRTQWDSARAQAINKMFLIEWDSPLPKSNGVCFRDIYLNANWENTGPHPRRNCYMRVNYPFYIHDLLEEQPELNLQEH
eukprot:s462_g68.t1